MASKPSNTHVYTRCNEFNGHEHRNWLKKTATSKHSKQIKREMMRSISFVPTNIENYLNVCIHFHIIRDLDIISNEKKKRFAIFV